MEKEVLKTVLDDVEKETKRFLKKLNQARDRFYENRNNRYPMSTKESAAIKRAALDLKNELTRITQSIIYTID